MIDLQEKLAWRLLRNKPLEKGALLRFLHSELLRRGFMELLIKCDENRKRSETAIQSIFDKPTTFANILMFSELARKT